MSQNQTYQVVINEDQRVALVALLKASERGGNEDNQITGEPEPLIYWISMLEDMPKVNMEHPGCIHGFCL